MERFNRVLGRALNGLDGYIDGQLEGSVEKWYVSFKDDPIGEKAMRYLWNICNEANVKSLQIASGDTVADLCIDSAEAMFVSYKNASNQVFGMSEGEGVYRTQFCTLYLGEDADIADTVCVFTYKEGVSPVAQRYFNRTLTGTTSFCEVVGTLDEGLYDVGKTLESINEAGDLGLFLDENGRYCTKKISGYRKCPSSMDIRYLGVIQGFYMDENGLQPQITWDEYVSGGTVAKTIERAITLGVFCLRTQGKSTLAIWSVDI